MVTPSTRARQIKPNWGRSCAHNCGEVSKRQWHCGGSVAFPREDKGELAARGGQLVRRGRRLVSAWGSEGIPRM
jgi:hypothetical protein